MKKAFSMIELIVVIVLIGILAFFLMPSGTDTKTLEAARQIISHIRYAQHLALNNDKFDSNDENWYKKFWRVSFSGATTGYKLDSCKSGDKCWRYSVWQDSAGGSTTNANSTKELALDPVSPGKYLAADYLGNDSGVTMTNFSKKMNLTDTYGIKNIAFNGLGGSTQSFMFDDLGRVYKPNLDAAYQSDKIVNDFIRITLTGKGGDEVKILVFAASGYACVENGSDDCVAPQATK